MTRQRAAALTDTRADQTSDRRSIRQMINTLWAQTEAVTIWLNMNIQLSEHVISSVIKEQFTQKSSDWRHANTVKSAAPVKTSS